MKCGFFLTLAAGLAAALCGCGSPPAPEPAARPAERTEPPAADPRPAIVCFGDSLTAGFGLDPGQSYPDSLQRELDRRGLHYRVVNLGVSGDSSQDGLDRVDLVLREKPVIVVLEFGANDGLRGEPPAGTRRNLSGMIDAITPSGARIVLAGMTLPPNYGPAYIPAFEAVFPEVAKQSKLPLIPFLLDGVAGHRDLMQADGLHPNVKGARIVAQTVLRVLEPLLH